MHTPDSTGRCVRADTSLFWLSVMLFYSWISDEFPVEQSGTVAEKPPGPLCVAANGRRRRRAHPANRERPEGNRTHRRRKMLSAPALPAAPRHRTLETEAAFTSAGSQPKLESKVQDKSEGTKLFSPLGLALVRLQVWVKCCLTIRTSISGPAYNHKEPLEIKKPGTRTSVTTICHSCVTPLQINKPSLTV